jgi:hypothetical protein
MPVFNVAAAVVELIEAPDAEAAMRLMRHRIRSGQATEQYEGPIESQTGMDAFESETESETETEGETEDGPWECEDIAQVECLSCGVVVNSQPGIDMWNGYGDCPNQACNNAAASRWTHKDGTVTVARATDND